MRRCNHGSSQGKSIQGPWPQAPRKLEAQPAGIVECPQCHEKKLSHRVCKHCGYYNGVQVIDMTEKKENA